MKLSRSLPKILAAVSSALLIGLYVYDRAGGNLLEQIYSAGSAKNEPGMMPSSKLKQMFPAVTDATTEREFMLGPKSAPVFEQPTVPVSPEPVPLTPLQQDTEVTPQPTKTLLHGSKSMSPVIPLPSSSDPPAQDDVLAPKQPVPNPKTMFHGSKYPAPLMPLPNSSANSAPNAPRPASQPPRQIPAKPQANQPPQFRQQ